MSTFLRAIIFGSELIGFIVFCIFATIKFYKKYKINKDEEAEIRRKTKYNIRYFVVNFAIMLAIFLFSYPSCIFLSYNKMLLITIFLLGSVINIITYICRNDNNEKIWLNIWGFNGFITIVLIIVVVLLTSAIGPISPKEVIETNELENSQIVPKMFSDNQIGYKCDEDGNADTYFYYYKNETTGKWNVTSLKASDVEMVELVSGDSYVIRKTTSTIYKKTERKPSAKDYLYTKITETYTIYYNSEQLIKIA